MMWLIITRARGMIRDIRLNDVTTDFNQAKGCAWGQDVDQGEDRTYVERDGRIGQATSRVHWKNSKGLGKEVMWTCQGGLVGMGRFLMMEAVSRLQQEEVGRVGEQYEGYEPYQQGNIWGWRQIVREGELWIGRWGGRAVGGIYLGKGIIRYGLGWEGGQWERYGLAGEYVERGIGKQGWVGRDTIQWNIWGREESSGRGMCQQENTWRGDR